MNPFNQLIRSSLNAAVILLAGQAATHGGPPSTSDSTVNPPPAVNPGFAVGDRIQVAAKASVNKTPSATTGIGTNPAESTGVIVEGPVVNGTDNIIWFRVDYDRGFDGWSRADNFVKRSAGPRPSPPTGGGTLVELWSFEDGMKGWTTNGNFEHCSSTPSRFASDGRGFVALNGKNSKPDAVLTRTLATTAGRTYAISFRISTQGNNQTPQALHLKVTGTSPLAESTSTIKGDGSGKSRWEFGQALTFVAPGTSVVVEFKDVSTSTTGVDLLLDEIQIVKTD